MSVKANQEKLRVMLSQVEKMNIDDSAIAEVKVAAEWSRDQHYQGSVTWGEDRRR